MRRPVTALFALVFAGSVWAGPCMAASYQAGVTTEDDVLQQLGQPESFSLKPDGSVVYVYRIPCSAGLLGYIPLLGLLVDDGVSGWTTETFTFDPSTKLTSVSPT
jgi:hypothetical protein